MQSFNAVLELQGILFLLMLIGIVLNKIKMIDATGRAYLTKLLINVILPCNIIYAFMVDFSTEVLYSAMIVLVLALGVQIFSWGLGKVLYYKTPKAKQSVLQYATMCSNAGFMGNPIVEGIFGLEGLLYASIYLIPLRFFMWTVGISCFTDMKFKEAIKKLAVHPCILAVWIGFFLMLTGITLPNFMSRTVGYLSGSTLPVSIIVIGTILAEVDIKTLFDLEALGYCFVRLVAIPGAVLAVCYFANFNLLITGVSVTLASMPAGSTTAILAEQYGGDAVYASKIILLSTALSLFSIPMFCFVIQSYF